MKKLKILLEGSNWVKPMRTILFGWKARHGGHPNWKILLKNDYKSWLKKLRHSKKSKYRVLIATSTGGHFPSTNLESLLGVALTLRETKTDFLLCDGVLTACMMCEIRWNSDLKNFIDTGPGKQYCNNCYEPAKESLYNLGMTVRSYSEYLNNSDYKNAKELSITIPLDKIPSFQVDNVAVGEHALAGTLRFFARGRIDCSYFEEGVLRKYLESSLLTLYAVKKNLSQQAYDCVVLHHGIYAPQGIVAELSRSMGIRVVIWHPAYRKNCFIFSHNETYHHSLMTEPINSWGDINWSDKLDDRITKYLCTRWTGSDDWISFQNARIFDYSSIEKEIGINFEKQCVGLLTNVFWDAQLHYPTNIFSDMLEWIIETIEYYALRPDIQLLIRVHPAEISGSVPSQQAIAEELELYFPDWPKNIFLIPPESHISSYVAMKKCNTVIVYGTKMGVEISCMGIPVIVAGEAWVKGKGITLDPKNKTEYFDLLGETPFNEVMSQKKLQKAKKYAYHYFFRRMIPLKHIQENNAWPPYKPKINHLKDLESSNCMGLDLICDGIINNTSFVYKDEDSSNFL